MASRIAICIFALLMLAGCSVSPAEELFRIPELPPEYTEFNGQLNVIREQGADLTAPVGGFNRQAVQLMDLDNDGIDEGVVFAKEKNGEKRALAYIFKNNGEEYLLHEKITGAGNLVESVSYADVMGNGNYAIIVGWGLEDNSARTLTAYEIAEDGMKKLVEAPYLHYAQADMDSDGITDLMVVMPDEKNKAPEVGLYTLGMGEFKMQSAVPLSQGIGEIRKIRSGYAKSGEMCIYVDSVFDDNRMITDIVAYTGNRIKNATRSEENGISKDTLRTQMICCEDPDGDGVIDIPYSEALPGYENVKEENVLCGIVWKNFSENAGLRESLYTYHDYRNEWHIVLPSKWKGKITADSMIGENGTVFYGINSKGEKKHLFSVYVLTGEQRYEKAQYPSRFQLTEKRDVIYAATIAEESYQGVKINEDSLREMFRWRETEWSSGEVVA